MILFAIFGFVKWLTRCLIKTDLVIVILNFFTIIVIEDHIEVTRDIEYNEVHMIYYFVCYCNTNDLGFHVKANCESVSIR